MCAFLFVGYLEIIDHFEWVDFKFL